MRGLALFLFVILSTTAEAQTFNSTAGGPIPDGIALAANSYGAPLDVPIVVTGVAQGTIDTVSIAFNANHSWVGDLEVTLVSPYGQEHLLFARTGATDAGGGSPANLVASNTYTFVDSAPTNWWTVANNPDGNFNIPSNTVRTVVSGGLGVTNPPPLTSLLNVFRRRPPNGTWVLRFRDGWAGDIGTVSAASITLSTTGVTRTVTKIEDTDDGNCSPTDCSLREAIEASSDAGSSVDRIEFARPFFDSPRRITLNSDLDLNPTPIIALIGPGVHLLNVSGAGRHEVVLVGSSGKSSRLTLSGFRLTDARRVEIETDPLLSQMEFAFGGTVRLFVAEINDTSIHSNNAVGPALDLAAPALLRRVTVSGNSSRPGLFNASAIGVQAGATIIDSTIVGNRSLGNDSAGGVLAGGNTVLQNTVVANNRAIGGSVAGQDVSGSFQSRGHNLIGDVGSVTAFNQTGDQTGTLAAPLNPGLSPLSRNGGTIPVHVPLPGSPLLDQGRRVSRDSRGLGLIDLVDVANSSGGNGGDIGAVELSPRVVSNLNDSGPGSLRQILQDAPLPPAVTDVVFDVAFPPGATIALTSGQLSINRDVAIHGPGAKTLTISGNRQSRVIAVGAGWRVAISGVTLADGNGVGTPDSGVGGLLYQQPGAQVSVVESVLRNGAAESNRAWRVESAYGELIASTVADFGPESLGTVSVGFGSTFLVHRSTLSGCSFACLSSSNNTDFALIDSTVAQAGRVAVAAIGRLYAKNTLLDGTLFDSTSTVSGGHNLIGITTSTAFNQDGDQVGTEASPINPRLSPLALHGGPVPTHVPLAGSPALDKGVRFAPDARGQSVFDIGTIGAATSGDDSDIGAVEVQALFVRNTLDSGVDSLRDAVTAANANGTALDDVLFDLPPASTINLTSRLPNPVSGGALNLLGSGANQLTLTGSNAHQLFSFTGTGHLGISQLTLTAFQGVDGPALEVYQTDVHLTGLQVFNNQASRDGGAMLIGAADAVIDSCTFAGNAAISNHGAVAYYGDNSRLLVRNSTFSGNTGPSSSALGNVAIGAGTSLLDIDSTTIADNSGAPALASVAISTGTAVSSAANTLFKGTSSSIANSGATASFVSRGFNLSSTSEPQLNQTSDRVNASPNLGPLQNNGGKTFTRALQFPSDAIDAGIGTSLFDQRGNLRPFIAFGTAAPGSDGSDIGAFELRISATIFRNGFE